jgi:hypothetical protein
MGKRKLVSAAVHSELSDYTQLIRALKTERTTDLTGHLLSHAAASSQSRSLGHREEEEEEEEEEEDKHNDSEEEEKEEEGDEDEDDQDASVRIVRAANAMGGLNEPRIRRNASGSSQTTMLGEKSEAGESNGGNDDEQQSPKKKRKKNTGKSKAHTDMWTRWPLESLPVPEWSLEDEVMHIAAMHQQSASSRLASSLSSPDNDDDVDSAEEQSMDDVDEAHLPGLVEAAQHHLEHVLATLAAHLPAVAPGMHKRLAPLDWQAVLGALEGVAGIHIADE